jgi:hypothetical protein
MVFTKVNAGKMHFFPQPTHGRLILTQAFSGFSCSCLRQFFRHFHFTVASSSGKKQEPSSEKTHTHEKRAEDNF